MAEEKKLAKRLRTFKQSDEATLVAALYTTTMNQIDLKAANEGMDHLYNTCKQIQQESMEPTETTTSTSQRTIEESFKLFLDQFLEDLRKYELRQDLDQFKIGIEDFLSLRNGLHTDFQIHLRETYLTKIVKYQSKINRVDLLLAHDRGFIWDQEQRAHELMEAGNWKENEQILCYSYRTVTNYINFFNLSTYYPRILTSSSYFTECCTFLRRFKEELKKNTTLSIRCAEALNSKFL